MLIGMDAGRFHITTMVSDLKGNLLASPAGPLRWPKITPLGAASPFLKRLRGPSIRQENLKDAVALTTVSRPP